MKTNTAVKQPARFTHEGGPAKVINAEQELRRSVMTAMLWEDSFYENGVDVADRVQQLVHQIPVDKAAAIAVEARSQMYLRHMPLLIAREIARHPGRSANPSIVSSTIEQVIQRADELGEFVSLYWKDKKQPLSAQVKKGLARAFNKFSEYNLAKYNRDAKVRLRDVAFLAHVRPDQEDNAGSKVEFVERKYKNGSVKTLVRHVGSNLNKLVNGTLATPDTWEVALSGGKDKKETFLRLLEEKKLGGLAFLRNLRNMEQAGVTKSELVQLVGNVNFAKVLPFRFIAAAKVVPQWEDLIEPLMLQAAETLPKLPGKTILLIDVSGSMAYWISGKSDLSRIDAAAALAILLREVCEDVAIATFETNVKAVRPRRGFALRDEVGHPRGGTDLGKAVQFANANKHDRLIVISDEQSHTRVPAPLAKRSYMLNVAAYRNGIGYGQGWTANISGFSENVVRFITVLEGLDGADEQTEPAARDR
jgi:hypothetical protein